MTGMNFPVTEFYVNNNTTADGLHPYAKKADNFRRSVLACKASRS